MRYKTATQWGVYDVEVENGRIRSVHNLSEDPDPAPMGQTLVDGVQHRLRIKSPAIRKGWLQHPERSRDQRGQDEFVEVPWDEAFEIAATEIRRVIDELGNTSIFAGSYGWASAGRFHHAQSQLHRFINLLGGSTRAMNSYSTAAAQVILPRVIAPWSTIELSQASWPELAEHCELMVNFGGVPLRNTQVAYGGITEHQSAGGLAALLAANARILNISPVQSDLPETPTSNWMPCYPGTDVALMLGLAYVLDQEDLCDRAFLESHCVGFPSVQGYLTGEQDGVAKTPQWAEGICGVPSDQIVQLARDMAKSRTFITAAWSLQRAHHGEQPYWMVVTLAAMLGQVGLPGCGFGFGYGAEGFVGSPWRRFNWATFSKGLNPTRFAIPVARIADMLLSPGEKVDYDGTQITYPQIDLIYWAGGNPFHHHQDLNRLVRAWRKPSTVIVNEPWWTPTAQWADIVFPATTALEREDLCASSHDPYAHVMQAALAPQHDARSDHDIFCGLARQLDIEETFTENRTPREWLVSMWERSQQEAEAQGFTLPDFETFWRQGTVRIPDVESRPVFLADFRENPQAHPLKTPSGKIELFSEDIDKLAYGDCPGHAQWMEPFERLGGQASDRFGLHLLSPQPANKLHSQLDHSAHSHKAKRHGKEQLFIHPNAAQQRGLEDGQLVRVFNDRGACLAYLCFDAARLPEVVSLPTGSWFKPLDEFTDANGNPNILTADVGTSSLAQGPSANTCLVEVEAVTDEGLIAQDRGQDSTH